MTQDINALSRSIEESLDRAGDALSTALNARGLSTSSRALSDPEILLLRYTALGSSIHNIGATALAADSNDELFKQLADSMASTIYYARRMGVDLFALIGAAMDARLTVFGGNDGEPRVDEEGAVIAEDASNLDAYFSLMRHAYADTAIAESFFTAEVQEVFTNAVAGVDSEADLEEEDGDETIEEEDEADSDEADAEDETDEDETDEG